MKQLVRTALVTLLSVLVIGSIASASDPLVLWAPPEESLVLEELIAEWTLTTGIDVNIIDVPFIAQHEKLSLDGPAGRGPDVFTSTHDQLGKLVLPGLISPMEVSDEILEAFPRRILEAVSYEGVLYGLPRSAEGVALIYNRDIIKEIPETLDELLALAKEMPGDVYGFLYDNTNVFFNWGFFSGYGAYIFGETDQGYDVFDIGLDKPEAVRALEFLVGLSESGLIPPGTNYEVAHSLFLGGKVGATINGSWVLADYRNAGIDYAVGLIPPLADGDVHRPLITVGGWSISSFSSKKDQARQLVEFLASEEVAARIFEEVGTIPAHLRALEHPAMKSDPDLKSFAEQSSRGVPTPNVPEMVAVWQPFTDAVMLALNGTAEPKVALSLAVADLMETIEDLARAK